MRCCVGPKNIPFGRDDHGGQKVVGGEAVLCHQPAKTATERQPGDPSRRHGTPRDGEPMLGGSSVQLSPDDAGTDAGSGPACVDGDGLHLRKVDHHAVVGHCATGHIMAAASNRHLHADAVRKRKSGHDIVCRVAAHDQRGPAIDQTVVDCTRCVIAPVVGIEHAARELSAEVGDEPKVECSAHQKLLTS